ncbi:MAG: acyl-CoA dehydrogenase family protein [Halioglobus sp.]|nr:acyl-CoA dehydrogenase family protein [Halioglobus sp.]
MDFDFTEKEQAFRAEVKQFIADNLPPPEQRDENFEQQWHAKLGEKKWIGFSWPREHGGGGGTLIEQFILKEEMSKAMAPDLGSDFMGLTWVGPALIRHGTEEQKKEFMPDLLNCRSSWCTGYSEPDVGSDLGSLKLRAVRDGDDYVINGSKIWTTKAHVAKYIFLTVRTNPEAESRYRGISVLLTPMNTPGIEVRPIVNIVGLHHFNQVFFTDVRVPVSARLGAEGEGWKVVMGALANERSGISESTGMERHLEKLKDLARKSFKGGKPALEDAEVRRKIARFETQIAAMRLNGLRNLTKQIKGAQPSSETSVNKLLRGKLEIPMSDLAMGLLGNEATGMGEWQHDSFNFHGTVIGGGSPNIQRNIIAERVLGLPKD